MKNMRKKWLGWAVALNETALRKRHPNITPAEFSELDKKYKALHPSNPTQEGLFQPQLAILKGPDGQVAYIRNDSSYDKKNNMTLVVELPLSFGIRENRKSVDIVAGFFRPLLTADFEEADSSGEFHRLTRKHYTEKEIEESDGLESFSKASKKIVRFKRFDQIRRSYSKHRDFFEKRNAWIKKKYATLRKKRFSEYDAYDEISRLLLKRKSANIFGAYPSKKAHPFELSADAIRSIVKKATNLF